MRGNTGLKCSNKQNHVGTLSKEMSQTNIISLYLLCFHGSNERGRLCVQHHQGEPPAYGGVLVHRIERRSSNS